MFQFDFAERRGLFQLFQPRSRSAETTETIFGWCDIGVKHGVSTLLNVGGNPAAGETKEQEHRCSRRLPWRSRSPQRLPLQHLPTQTSRLAQTARPSMG